MLMSCRLMISNPRKGETNIHLSYKCLARWVLSIWKMLAGANQKCHPFFKNPTFGRCHLFWPSLKTPKNHEPTNDSGESPWRLPSFQMFEIKHNYTHLGPAPHQKPQKKITKVWVHSRRQKGVKSTMGSAPKFFRNLGHHHFREAGDPAIGFLGK